MNNMFRKKTAKYSYRCIIVFRHRLTIHTPLKANKNLTIKINKGNPDTFHICCSAKPFVRSKYPLLYQFKTYIQRPDGLFFNNKNSIKIYFRYVYTKCEFLYDFDSTCIMTNNKRFARFKHFLMGGGGGWHTIGKQAYIWEERKYNTLLLP